MKHIILVTLLLAAILFTFAGVTLAQTSPWFISLVPNPGEPICQDDVIVDARLFGFGPGGYGFNVGVAYDPRLNVTIHSSDYSIHENCPGAGVCEAYTSGAVLIEDPNPILVRFLITGGNSVTSLAQVQFSPNFTFLFFPDDTVLYLEQGPVLEFYCDDAAISGPLNLQGDTRVAKSGLVIFMVATLLSLSGLFLAYRLRRKADKSS